MNDNPYQPPDLKAEVGLICPHCDTRFRLTWARYARRPFGDHRCPSCGETSKLRTSWMSHVTLTLAGLIGALIAILIGAALEPKVGGIAYAVCLAGMFLLIVIVDRHIDERRPLDPLP